jgi:elongation factor G
MALAKLAEEDPTFKVKTDEDSGQTIIAGMGELHLEILVDRLKREFKVECNQGRPQVTYKEAVISSATHREVYKKQTGGRGKFADIQFELGPADENVVGLQFIDEVKGGNIPREYMPAIQKGFRESMSNGVLAGFSLDSLKVRVFDGSYHAVDSDSLSFEMAARLGFKAACRKAKLVLLEPIMKIEVLTPDESLGDITGDLNKRRAVLREVTAKVGSQAVKADVPLSEMFGYVTSLRTLSSGRASSSMEFSHFQTAPESVAEAVINKSKGIVK